MPWTTPATYSIGDILTAANLNTYLRDNMNMAGPTRTQASFAPANPAGTTSTSGVMMGLALAFTPVMTGRILVLCKADIQNNTAGDGGTFLIGYGTGTAPVNGAALTGSVVGVAATQAQVAAASKSYSTCTFGIATGLTLSTAIWIDLRLLAVTGGTAALQSINVVVLEI
jgi:hypothetical protein